MRLLRDRPGATRGAADRGATRKASTTKQTTGQSEMSDTASPGKATRGMESDRYAFSGIREGLVTNQGTAVLELGRVSQENMEREALAASPTLAGRAPPDAHGQGEEEESFPRAEQEMQTEERDKEKEMTAREAKREDERIRARNALLLSFVNNVVKAKAMVDAAKTRY